MAQEITNADGSKSYKLYVYNEEDEEDANSLYTLLNLEVNPDVIEDYALLPVKLNPELGETGGTIQRYLRIFLQNGMRSLPHWIPTMRQRIPMRSITALW